VRLWRRLEQLVGSIAENRLTQLSRGEVREFAQLYRRTAADLAIARNEYDDPLLVNYLNGLVGKAHSAIYRTQDTGFGSIIAFFRYDFPAAFRKASPFIATAFAVTLAFAGIALLVTAMDERFADVIVGPNLRHAIIEHKDWTLEINGSNPIHSALIQQNNIMVSITAFAGGIFAGLGTFAVLAFNGLMLGVVVGLCVRYGFGSILVFMSGHGVLELTAIFIAGGAGFMLGSALIMPGDRTRGDALVERGAVAIKLLLGCTAMLVVAGIIEGFLSPALIHPAWKLSVSALSAVALAVYFMLPDHNADAGAKGGFTGL
jgi:uncharacterized membrane protein SpoIIM required for sporulation